jgi:hypothetical protein
VSQPHIIDTLFNASENTDKEKYKKIIKKLPTNNSVENRRKDKDNQTINVSKSPRIYFHKTNAFKYNSKMKEKRIFYKKYINTSLNKNFNYQNDSIFKADSFDINLQEKSQEKKVNLNLKGYIEYKKK